MKTQETQRCTDTADMFGEENQAVSTQQPAGRLSDRAAAIVVIEHLYPADHADPLIQVEGEKLLERARAITWREESTEVLQNYARLCLERAEALRRQAERDSDRMI